MTPVYPVLTAEWFLSCQNHGGRKGRVPMADPEPILCESCGAAIEADDAATCSKCGQVACAHCVDGGLCVDCQAPPEDSEPVASEGLFPDDAEEEAADDAPSTEPPSESVQVIKIRLQEALQGTATPFWRRFYQWVIAEKQSACASLETETKGRNIAQLQERILVMKEIKSFAREPGSFFNELRQDHPMLCNDVKDGCAEFNDESGVLSFTKS